MKYFQLSELLHTDERSCAIFIEKSKITKSNNQLIADNHIRKEVINYGLFCSIIMGRGTSITHDAMELLASTNTSLVVASNECKSIQMLSLSPTANTTKIYKQIEILQNENKLKDVQNSLLNERFNANTSYDEYQKLGQEGHFMKCLYQDKSKEYGVKWIHRDYNATCGINARLNLLNSCLYGITTAVIHTLGMSPYIGFIHKSSSLPFVYDLSDCVKKETSIDVAFECESKQTTNEMMINMFIDRCDGLKITKKLSTIALSILK
ncbi:MAG: CRISPR-associated endonuclease Cas1 [Paludibacteraceae bacterium]|nr:CRISPR-associated endonuclease Cas1 [Paludibacteraceae bacterium]